ncbi:hypothetical protein JCM10212_004518 [Sporobolomyces blumeae]
MQRTLESCKASARTIGRRLASSAASSSSSSSASSPSPRRPSASSDASPTSSGASTSATTPPSHYLVTLLRSPLHLEPSIKHSLASLGLYKRLASSIVPINSVNAGYVLRAKELVGVKAISQDDVDRLARDEWRERPGEGRQGSGLRVRHGSGENGVIRVGSERARGDERGYKVVA